MMYSRMPWSGSKGAIIPDLQIKVRTEAVLEGSCDLLISFMLLMSGLFFLSPPKL